MRAQKSKPKTTKSKPTGGQDLTKLEYWVDELVKTCERLVNENTVLRAQEEDLVSDRARVMGKKERVRDRVDAMIMRLKALEKN